MNRWKNPALLSAAAVVCCTGQALAQLSTGADIIYSGVNGVTTYGPLNGKYAYALGSDTCNIGNQNLEWSGTGMNGSPGLAMNLYRIHNGRLVQLGESFVKHACCAAAGNGCTTVTGTAVSCNGVGGSQLGVGCKDVYSSGYNGGHSGLGARSNINAWTGAFLPRNTGTGDTIFKRLQVAQSDMNTTTWAGAQYFAEGVYVSTRDAQANNRNNNASYRRVTNTSNGATLTPANTSTNPTVTTVLGVPAIQAWRDHGLGANLPDTSVTVGTVDVPDEGRFYFAHKPKDNGNGTWRYEYAVFNLSSDRSGGSLEIPVPDSVNVSNLGFSAPLHHSNEVYNNDVWTMTRGSGKVTFATAQTHAVNANANALRWGTMYNFWFDASTPPAAGTQSATLGLFKPGATPSVQFPVAAPGAPQCDSIDFNNDSLFPDVQDALTFVSVFAGAACPTTTCNDIDFNNDGLFPDIRDIDAFLNVMQGGACTQ